MQTIEIIERRRRSLAQWEADAIIGSDITPILLKNKIFSIRLVSQRNWEIEGGAYSGSVLISSEIRLTIRELVPGTVNALFSLAEPSFLRLIERASLIGNGKDDEQQLPLAAKLWEYFLNATNIYISMGAGAEKEYLYQTVTSSRPRGKILLRDSIRTLRSKGINDALVCRPIALSIDTPRNRLIKIALQNIIQCNPTTHFGQRAESLTYFLRGVLIDRALAFHARTGTLNYCFSDNEEIQTLEKLAMCILRGVDFFSEEDPLTHLPFAAFIRMYALFETAVFQIVAQWCLQHQDTAAKRKEGASGKCPVFINTGLIEAEPDIIISINGKDILTIDAKYIEFSGEIHHQNTYQLITHCGAYRSKEGWLIGVSTNGETRDRNLGATCNNIEIKELAVNPRSMSSAIRSALDSWLLRVDTISTVTNDLHTSP